MKIVNIKDAIFAERDETKISLHQPQIDTSSDEGIR
jgi:hypothetical protein